MTNSNDKTIDKILEELNILFEKYWLHPKHYMEPYTELMDKLKLYNNLSNKQDLLIVLQSKIDSKETSLNSEQTLWTTLFAIVGFFTTLAANHKEYLLLALLFIAIETILYCCAFDKTLKKKAKKKCFYKFVYNYLSQE